MSIGESTVLYLSVFLLTCLFTDRADKNFGINKRAAVFFSVIALFIPSLLAGVRADTVGKDVLEYAVRTFDLANSSTSYSYMREYTTEPLGYATLAYITARFFNNTGYFLFTSQVMVILPVYIIAYKKRNQIPMWQTMCAYMFLFYNNSFNVMKQSVSAVFIMLVYLYMKEHKKAKMIICFLIAFSFHFSAVFGLVFIYMAKFLNGKRNKNTKIAFVAISLFVLLDLRGISSFLLANSLLPEKYTRNIEAVFSMDTNVYLRIVGFNTHVFFDWVYKLFLVFTPLYLMRKVDIKVDKNIKILPVIGLAFYSYVLMMFRTIYGVRISLYCDMFLILLVPMITKVFRRESLSDKIAVNGFFVVFMGAYWFIWVMIYGWSASNYFQFRF